MALHWQWSKKIGHIKFQNREKKTYRVNIYRSDCLALFIYEYKDKDGQDMYQIYSFFLDKKHAQRCMKSNGRLFSDKIVDVQLNTEYAETKALTDLFLADGNKVTLFKKEIKNK